jgi:cobalt/nickel transport system ATP-binding protein
VPFSVEALRLEAGGREVLRDVTFSVRPGERVVLLGVNGAGKTTLLKALDGLTFAASGRVSYDGVPLDARRLAEDSFRRRFRGEVGLLFQNVDAMLFNPTVRDEIAFGPRQLGLADVDGRVARWAETFALTGLLERPPFELSGGEKKRVALAAILAIQPRVLLLDEPTSSLDPASAGLLVDLLAGLHDVTVITSTHHLSIAGELGSRTVLLAPGRAGVRFDGPTAGLLADEALLVESGLAHRHTHRHGATAHAHYHVHDAE